MFKGTFYYNVRYSAVLRKPELLARLAKNVLLAKLGAPPVLRYIDVCASAKCNLTCEHCFATGFTASSRASLSLSEWREVATQAMDLGCVSFGLTGGEPLLYEQLIPLVANLAPERNLIAVNTNGTLLTEPLARELYHAKVDVLQFSVDSAIAEEHDRFRRRKGAFAETMRAIQIARRQKLRVTIACTLTPQNIRTEGIRRLLELAAEQDTLVILSRSVPAGRWLGREDVLLSKDDYRILYGWVARYPHVRTDMDTNYARYGCSAATEKVYVTPTGDVIPCPYMHISFGNVRDDSLAAIRHRMLSVSCLSNYSQACLVAEDPEFIEKRLSKTFGRKGVVGWEECFKDSCRPDCAAAPKGRPE